MKETWKDIESFEGYYQISNIGNVKSLKRIVKRNGNDFPVIERILKPTSCTGYYRVMLCESSKMKAKQIHRLVAQAFIPNPCNFEFVNHKNGIKTDNRVENLEWCTKSYNSKHSYDTGLQTPKRGLLNGMAKITKENAIHIKYNHKDKTSSEVSKLYNISKSSVKSIRSNRTWKHI